MSDGEREAHVYIADEAGHDVDNSKNIDTNAMREGNTESYEKDLGL